MGKLAVMMSTDQPEGLMSSHFGKAEWIMLGDTAGGSAEFARNEGQNGRSVADLLIRQGCTDVILVDIGDGALRQLQAAKIGAWAAPGPVPGAEALRAFAEGRLAAVPAVSAASDHAKGGGCCCAGPAKVSTRCCG